MSETKVNILYGRVKIIPTYRVEGDTLIAGGYSITYDGDGNEVSRTKDEEISRLHGVSLIPKSARHWEK